MLKLTRMALRVGEPLLPLGRHVPFLLQRLVLEKAVARLFAEPLADGSYAITGTKIFISAGEHDLSENIVHLVLAKIDRKSVV